MKLAPYTQYTYSYGKGSITINVAFSNCSYIYGAPITDTVDEHTLSMVNHSYLPTGIGLRKHSYTQQVIYISMLTFTNMRFNFFHILVC